MRFCPCRPSVSFIRLLKRAILWSQQGHLYIVRSLDFGLRLLRVISPLMLPLAMIRSALLSVERVS